MSSSSYRSLNLGKTPLLATVAISNTTPVIAGPVKVIDFETFSFQSVWTGTLEGTISVLGSLDGVNYSDFGVTLSVQPSGSSGNVLVPLYGHGMKWLEIKFVPASGSGNYTVYALGKTR